MTSELIAKSNKYWLCALLFAFILPYTTYVYGQTVWPHDTRSDSIDVYHYDISLDVTDFTGFQLSGCTQVHFTPLVNGINTIDLDLIGLTVDSVKDAGGSTLTFNAHGLGYRTTLGSTYNTTDSTYVSVYYSGTPVQDPTFGGFYYGTVFAYNIGVSLDDIPHNYGKTWFPCFDNFTTRSTYDYHVITDTVHTASCGGMFQNITSNPDSTITHHWSLAQKIPSYLASVGVSDYVFVSDGYTNYLNDTVPVLLTARPSDTTNMKNSFVNLESVFDTYEDKFGPYLWDRVGFQLVPMTSGAMEHAMNIAYPILLANGSLAYESIMAHELSHHWWGNLVTCRTAEDMWINEGSAVYCEHVFTEAFYGRPQYEANIRGDWKEMLRVCHINDGGYWPLSGVPQNHTYGYTTYTKGALYIHSMRGYMGDSLFFAGLTELLNQNQFSDIDAIEYRDDLTTITGYDMTNFFKDWIFEPGWPHASIDSLVSVPSGPNYDVTVYLKQKLKGRTNYSTQMPITITFRDDNWNTYEATIYSDGVNNSQMVTVPFQPTFAYLNGDEKLCQASTGHYQTVTGTGNVSMAHANLTLSVQNNPDSSFVIVEHNWVAPDPLVDWTKGYTLSPQRYWRVDGIWPSGFQTNANLVYNGRTSGSSSYLDNELINTVEDSLILLYRPNRASDWMEFPTYTKNMGSPTDKVGTIVITDLQKGEYTLALKGQTIGIQDWDDPKVKLYPNPAQGIVTVNAPETVDNLVITNNKGASVLSLASGTHETIIDISSLSAGVYYVQGFRSGKLYFIKKLVIN